ncbi:hypothetical protein SAMN02745205_01844, partial [Porphyromonas cangingivalis]
NWGNALESLASKKSGEESEDLYAQAFGKYELATKYKPDDHEAYNNWGSALCELA